MDIADALARKDGPVTPALTGQAIALEPQLLERGQVPEFLGYVACTDQISAAHSHQGTQCSNLRRNNLTQTSAARPKGSTEPVGMSTW